MRILMSSRGRQKLLALINWVRKSEGSDFVTLWHALFPPQNVYCGLAHLLARMQQTVILHHPHMPCVICVRHQCSDNECCAPNATRRKSTIHQHLRCVEFYFKCTPANDEIPRILKPENYEFLTFTFTSNFIRSGSFTFQTWVFFGG